MQNMQNIQSATFSITAASIQLNTQEFEQLHSGMNRITGIAEVNATTRLVTRAEYGVILRPCFVKRD